MTIKEIIWTDGNTLIRTKNVNALSARKNEFMIKSRYIDVSYMSAWHEQIIENVKECVIDYGDNGIWTIKTEHGIFTNNGDGYTFYKDIVRKIRE